MAWINDKEILVDEKSAVVIREGRQARRYTYDGAPVRFVNTNGYQYRWFKLEKSFVLHHYFVNLVRIVSDIYMVMARPSEFDDCPIRDIACGRAELENNLDWQEMHIVQSTITDGSGKLQKADIEIPINSGAFAGQPVQD